MKRKEYSAGAVKMSFWFVEFRKVVQLLHDGKSMDEIKALAQSENIFAAPTALRPIRFIVPWPGESDRWIRVSSHASCPATWRHRNSMR